MEFVLASIADGSGLIFSSLVISVFFALKLKGVDSL